MTEFLPVYRVAPAATSDTHLIDLARRIFDLTGDFAIFADSGHRWLRRGDLVVELHRPSGLVWAANEAELWKPSLRPTLLEKSEAVATVKKWLVERSLLPKVEPPFRWGKPTIGGTHFVSTSGGQREERQLDTQVAFPVFVGEHPVTGGGGDVTVTLGHEGKIIGLSGGWRQVESSFESKRIDRDVADGIYQALMKNATLLSFDAVLAYYAAPPFTDQTFLYPVYVYRGSIAFRERRMAVRQVLIPATEFGPPLPKEVARSPRSRGRAGSLSSTTSSSSPRVRRSLATRSETNPFAAGAVWLGPAFGLPMGQANAQGFVDEWASAGWSIKFNDGDNDALPEHWKSSNDAGVDDVDWVFYTGHADGSGWVLKNWDGVQNTEVGPRAESPGDLWGQRDLEWIIIAACGPLQDETLAEGGGDVLQRWSGAFDGLHILMGYGASTQDNVDEGRTVARYARRGSSLIDAWFRTAKEIQSSTNGEEPPDGPTVYVGAMWATKDGTDPFGDHAWECGSVSEPPTPPTCYSCIWTMC